MKNKFLGSLYFVVSCILPVYLFLTLLGFFKFYIFLAIILLGAPTILSVVINLLLCDCEDTWNCFYRSSLIYLISLILVGVVIIFTPIGVAINKVDDKIYEWQQEEHLKEVHEKIILEDEKRWNDLVNSKPTTVEWKVIWDDETKEIDLVGNQPNIFLQSQRFNMQEIKLTNTTDETMILKNINLAYIGEDYIAGVIDTRNNTESPNNQGEWVFIDKSTFDELPDIENCRQNTNILSLWVNNSNCFIHEENSSNVHLAQDLDLIIEPKASKIVKINGKTTFYRCSDTLNARPLNREIQFVIEQVDKEVCVYCEQEVIPYEDYYCSNCGKKLDIEVKDNEVIRN